MPDVYIPGFCLEFPISNYCHISTQAPILIDRSLSLEHIFIFLVVEIGLFLKPRVDLIYSEGGRSIFGQNPRGIKTYF